MSREAYAAEARSIIAQAQQAAAADMQALYDRHLQRAQEAVTKLAASASRNGVRPPIQGQVVASVRQVLVAPRVPVFTFTYL